MNGAADNGGVGGAADDGVKDSAADGDGVTGAADDGVVDGTLLRSLMGSRTEIREIIRRLRPP